MKPAWQAICSSKFCLKPCRRTSKRRQGGHALQDVYDHEAEYLYVLVSVLYAFRNASLWSGSFTPIPLQTRAAPFGGITGFTVYKAGRLKVSSGNLCVKRARNCSLDTNLMSAYHTDRGVRKARFAQFTKCNGRTLFAKELSLRGEVQRTHMGCVWFL